MKKFLFSIIILAVFGGAVFFLGWIQFYVPNGRIGVMTSKTSGTDPVPIRPGEFRWAWEKLLPTNCAILVFEAKPETTALSHSGTLPSAEFYSRFLDSSPDFSWNVSADVSVKPRAEALPSLVETYGVRTDEGLRNFVATETARAFRQALEKRVDSMAREAAAGSPEAGGGFPRAASLDSAALADILSREMPAELELLSASVTEASFPDFNLYGEGAEIYASYSKRYREAATAAALRAAEAEIEEKEQMRRFAEWGGFLQKFPSLVDFLAVARDDAAGTLDLLRDLKAGAGGAE